MCLERCTQNTVIALSHNGHGKVKFWPWVYKILEQLDGQVQSKLSLIPLAMEVTGESRF